MEKYRKLLPLSLDLHWWESEMGRMYIIRDFEEYQNSPAAAVHDELEAKIGRCFSRMAFEEFQMLHDQMGKSMIYNWSIWYNTLYYEMREKDVFRLLRLRRYQLLTSKNAVL